MATFTVTNAADSGSGSLRQAISQAGSNDYIEFDSDYTIILTSGEILITKNLTINSRGAAITISGDNASRVFNIWYGAVTINKLVITSGNAHFGGAIYNDGTLTITNSTLSSNNTDAFGGAIHNDGTLTITNSTLSSNNAKDYGGAICSFGTSTITNSMLSSNHAGSGGGAISNDGTSTITSSTLSSNHAGEDGGAIHNVGTLLTITNSTLSNNNADYRGGAIYNIGLLIISFSTIAENQGSNVIYNSIYNKVSKITFKSSIVANYDSVNYVSEGGTISAIDKNLSSDDTCPDFKKVTREELKLGPLALNPPGLTATYALLPGSQAIDYADDCTDIDGNPVTTDQRGVPRPQNGICDVGAYEAMQELFEISENALPEHLIVGHTFIYNITVRNIGRIPLSSVIVTNKLSTEVDFKTASKGYSYNPSKHEVSWSTDSIPKGQSLVLTVEVKPKIIGTITNIVTVTSPDSQTAISTYRDNVGAGMTFAVNAKTITAWSYPDGIRICGLVCALDEFLLQNRFKLVTLYTLGGWAVTGLVIENSDGIVRLSDGILQR